MAPRCGCWACTTLFPWLHWDGRQAVLFDLPARKFHVFGLTFWPQDFLFLALLLIMAALSLFFFTALAGRLWCGYACPQTVWTEVFLMMERWTEGERNQRLKLDAGPWNAEKLRRKGTKHLLWAVFALWTGFTFVGFFTPIQDLAARAWPFAWGGWETFWVLFYGFATWGNAGFLREQVCKYMCPYARFQSAMFDRNTLIIAYDPMRGEPRGARKRGLPSVLQRARGLLDKLTAYDYVFRASQHPTAAEASANARGTITFDAAVAAPLPQFAPEQLGDCVNCTICVQVCPTGIDIRNGLQYECIACGACIDGCDDVMDKLGYPQGVDPLFHAERHRRQAHAHPATAHHRLWRTVAGTGTGLGLGRHASQHLHRRSAARPQCAVPRSSRTARSRTRTR